MYIYLTCVGRDPSLVQPLEQQAHAVCRVPNLRLVQVVVFAVLPHQANLPCKVSVSAIAIVSLKGRREGGTGGGNEGDETRAERGQSQANPNPTPTPQKGYIPL